jgi:prevent-host-death family protein
MAIYQDWVCQLESGTFKFFGRVDEKLIDLVFYYAYNLRKSNMRGSIMKTATVGEIQKNFAQVLREIKAGEEIVVTRRGKPVAVIVAMGAKKGIDWPDFFNEGIEIKGKPVSRIVIEDREDRF